MLSWPCAHCEKPVIIDPQTNQPTSLYWLPDPEETLRIMAVFCKAECATNYNEKIKNESE